MDRSASQEAAREPRAADADELQRATELRRQADWRLPMSERLARLNELCKQAAAIKDAARPS